MTGQLKQVMAYEAWAIFADYDANAPTTQDLLTVGTHELARELVDLFNKNPRAVPLAYVDGWEHAKRYDCRKVLLPADSEPHVAWTKEDALTDADLTEEDLAEDMGDDED
jgi:hypothetical protein